MIFQVDHPLVCQEYEKENFRIVIDEARPEGGCAIYFSSNDIYFPNNEGSFRHRIVEKDSFEWYGNRINGVRKHIFVRDIRKQWYLTGINSRINTPDRLLKFLELETAGLTVVAVGSSAGGYAAVLYGSLLRAERILSFNGQMELNSLLETSNELVNPIIFSRQETDLRRYYDVKPFLRRDAEIFYFYSIASDWDARQAAHIVDSPIKSIGFSSSHHGIPFFKCTLRDVLDFSNEKLIAISGRRHHPLVFSIANSGIWRVGTFSLNLLGTVFRRKVVDMLRGKL